MEAANSRWATVLDWLWFFAWALGSSAVCLSAAARLGPTFDEPVYVAKGLEHWRTGSYDQLMHLGTMPLPVDVETLPLYVWERWRGQPFDPEADLAKVLPVARAASLFFWWLLLFYARLAGRAVAGGWGGRLAVALLASEPSFLAHVGLATTDISVTACLLALAYHFRMGRTASWPRRIALPAVWFGLALLAKASALVYGPLVLFAVELDRWVRDGALRRQDGESWAAWVRGRLASIRPLFLELGIIVGCGVAMMMIYIGSDWHAEPTFIEWADQLGPGTAPDAMRWCARNLRVFTNGGEGLVQQIKHNIRGHGAYLFGHSDSRALWYYFPLLLTLKLTVSLLVGFLLVALFSPRALGNWLCVAALVVIVLSPLFRVQLGIRLVLPIVSLAVVGLAAALVHCWQQAAPGWRKWAWQGLAAGCVLWGTFSVEHVWPHALCYVNELWGGTSTGYQYVSETNYDWGQGLKELAAWQQRTGNSNLEVWYYGSDPASKQSFHLLPLHMLPINSTEDARASVQGRLLAVSTTLLYGMDRSGENVPRQQAAAFLRTCKPVARTMTFLIYDFTDVAKDGPESNSVKNHASLSR
jgi:hypothetical protein